MNAKCNLSISRWIALLGLVLCAQQTYSQDISEWEPWRAGRNIAGLAVDGSGEVKSSNAELTGGVTTGDFRSASEAPTLWSAGAAAETEVHLRKLIMTGDFSFSVDKGNEMTGSMFTNPGYYPVDILEFTPGPKTRQTYTMGGGFAWKNGSAWTPGATIRFLGSNYSKRKDLRHTTYRQEFELVPSVTYNGGSFAVGASAVIGRNSEFIQAEQIGSATADSYYAFLDKGMMYGTYQVWNGSGTHLSESGVDRFPVREFSYGLALQGSLGKSLYGEVEYVRSSGEAGEKGYTWFRFPGEAVEGKIIGTLHGPSGVHSLRGDLRWSRQLSDETVIEKVSEGGVTVPVEYASNRVFERRSLTGGPTYSFYGRSGFYFTTSVEFEYAVDRVTLMYPFVDTDTYHNLWWNASATIPLGDFEIEAALLAGGNVGGHNHIIDNIDLSPGIMTEPFRLTEWWEREEEFEDAFRLGADIALKYNFSIADKYNMYVGAKCSLIHAFGLELIEGPDRIACLIKLGYDF